MLLGFIIGISSAFHCLGMCGPIAMAIPVNRKSTLTALFDTLQYNLGRISSYSLLGLLIGFIGLTVQSIQWMQWLSIAAGIVIILIAWHQFFRIGESKYIARLSVLISRGIGKVIRSTNPLKLIGLGALNGLLPCGMVFIALTNALVQPSIVESVLAMFFFGLGTLPMMVSITFFASRLSGAWRQKVSKFIPYLMTIVGLLVVLRGLNLGIPYISPKIEMIYQNDQVLEAQPKPQVQMKCCTPETSPTHTHSDSLAH
jgi:uncharacterized protein